MTSAEISSKRKWDKSHQLLSRALQKEIGLMREFLANLYQEELSLLEQSQKRWSKVMSEQSDIVVQLKSVREVRTLAIQKLEEMKKDLGKKEILPLEEAESCEILTQLDQLLALMDRINLQNCRNDYLYSLNEEVGSSKQYHEKSPLRCPYPHPLHRPQRTVRRTSTAVHDQEEPF